MNFFLLIKHLFLLGAIAEKTDSCNQYLIFLKDHNELPTVSLIFSGDIDRSEHAIQHASTLKNKHRQVPKAPKCPLNGFLVLRQKNSKLLRFSLYPNFRAQQMGSADF